MAQIVELGGELDRGVLGGVSGRSASWGFAPPSGSAGTIKPDSLTKTGTEILRGPFSLPLLQGFRLRGCEIRGALDVN